VTRFRQNVLTISFPLSGVVTTMLGPLLPAMIARWGLSDAQAGQLFLAQFLASTAGALCSASVVTGLGTARAIGGSDLVMGIAVASLMMAPPVGVLLSVAIYGFTLGVSIPAVNLSVGLDSAERKVARLNLLNMACGLGAVASLPGLTALLAGAGLDVALTVVGALCVASGVCCLLATASGGGGVHTGFERLPITATLRWAAVTAGAFLFLYVGAENGINGWLSLFARRHLDAGASSAATALALLWICILVARLAASSLPRVRPQNWIRAGLAAAFAGTVLIVSANSVPPLVAGSVTAGRGLGPIFPTAVAIFQDRTGSASARLIGWIFAAAGGGGALSWLIGTVSSSGGSLRIGLLTVLAATVGMVLTGRLFTR
jgi:MFS transporter, FHS family, glucose/mannose:H+ symporter